MKRNRVFRIICLFMAFIMASFVICTEILIGNAYKPTERALQFMEGDQNVDVKETVNYIVFESKVMTNDKGIIFYPGGSVDEESYAPLMYSLAEAGYRCVLVKMPFYLAVLDINAADNVLKELDKNTEWYIAGHSLGGAMAATYAADNAHVIKGVILLAAYSTKDLTKDNLEVLSIYGSMDCVLNMENYEAYRSNLPADTTELILNGGNHANFGNYGAQKGDGVAELSAEAQQTATVEAICEFLE